ncbi:tripartite-type tricarboxylate transporter receptor subunit TctC [Humitalea rosea]|uniref:Tripartite-type tricarboxylate transporter receptor subunit TctC n=1 Tax=Humitalea rosea TaxID=990373 RepID=A0A2W7IUG3_9PROT|nr:tripartite tricarboxylate transporter substrate binding protein [Humitalea rosea]PZW51084.1 tripartite-type tricarboxylate transporter receptor subunit TctC [Humitalea rosea]
MPVPRRSLLAAGVTAAFVPAAVRAQPAWPSRPIRFVVPFSPGGGSDIVARLLADELTQRLGQPLIIENRPGQAASIGAAYTAQQPPDGYTILICTPGVQMTNPYLYPSLPYDPEHGFTPIVHIAQLPNILVVHPSLPVTNVAEFIAYARANPDKLSFSSTGSGSSSHLAAELFMNMSGTHMVHVPYRSSGQALIDLTAGRVEVTLDSFAVMMPAVRAGQLRLLGISTAQRMEDYPEIPAIAETLPGYEGTTLLYMVGPAGLPAPIVQTFNAAFNEVLRLPRIRQRFREMGMAASGGTPEELAKIIDDGRVKWRRVIEIAGVKVD